MRGSRRGPGSCWPRARRPPPARWSSSSRAIDADLASGYWVAGDEANAKRLYGRALTRAEALENARPRALAVVEICRSMGREQVPASPETRARLDALYAGLRDPW